MSLGDRLVRCLTEIRQIPYMPKGNGHSFDATARAKIVQDCGLAVVDAAEFKSSDAWSHFREKVKDCVFSFEEASPRPSAIYQPFGSQNWPDLLIIAGKSGSPVEFKTGQDDKIVWNSGKPKEHGIYILNSGGGKGPKARGGTTFFLGRHSLTAAETAIMDEFAEFMRDAKGGFDARLKALGSGWSCYPRPMFNDSGRYLTHSDRRQRERETMDMVAKQYVNVE